MALAIVSVNISCSGVNCAVSRNSGLFNWTLFGRISLIKKPLSAITKSPDSSWGNIPLCNVITFLEVDPRNRLLT